MTESPNSVPSSSARGTPWAPKRALDPLRGITELFLEPSLKRGIVQTTSLRLSEDRKQRVDARFHGALPQQIGTEAMNGADLRFFQSAKRVV